MKTSISANEALSHIDWFIFFSILGLTFLSVLWGNLKKRKNSSADLNYLDYLIMGRRLTLPMFVATLVATWYGGIFGVTKIAFEQGIFNFVTQGLFWYLSYLVFAFFLVGKISSYQAVTLPNLIGKMFGTKSAYLAAIFNLFNVLPITYVISIGLFLQFIFSGSLVLNMLIGLIIVLSYSSFGGFRSVVFSDIIQFFVMCLGVFFVLFFSIYNYGGISFLKSNLPFLSIQISPAVPPL